MAKLTFKTDICKGCGLCVNACPKHLLMIAKDKINKKNEAPLALKISYNYDSRRKIP